MEYVKGIVMLPIDEIIGVQDSFSKERSLDEVRERGFDISIVETQSLDSFVSTWNRKKFLEEYDKHIEKLQANIEEDDDDETITISMEEYIDLLELERQSKFSPWKKLKNIFKNQI